MGSSPGSDRSWLQVFVGVCQILAARSIDEPAGAILRSLREDLCALPQDVGFAEQLLISGLVSQVLARIVHRDPELSSAVGPEFVTFAAWSNNTKYRKAITFVDRCIDRLNELRTPQRCESTHARELLRLLDVRFRDPRLTLATFSREVRVSRWQVTRVLKRDTGRTFLAHVHARRITEASALLARSRLTVKEIAAQVGYTSVTQLDRHYKRRYGLTPTGIRIVGRERIHALELMTDRTN
jgi:AraC-like DNA-binding protein